MGSCLARDGRVALSFVTKSFSMSSVSTRREAARVSKETITRLTRDRACALRWEELGEAGVGLGAARVGRQASLVVWLRKWGVARDHKRRCTCRTMAELGTAGCPCHIISTLLSCPLLEAEADC